MVGRGLAEPPWRVQLCGTISDFGAGVRSQQIVLLIGGTGMQGMFAIGFLYVINLCGTLENVNESM